MNEIHESRNVLARLRADARGVDMLVLAWREYPIDRWTAVVLANSGPVEYAVKELTFALVTL